MAVFIQRYDLEKFRELTGRILRAQCQRGMHGIRSLFTASQLKRLDDNNDESDDDSYL